MSQRMVANLVSMSVLLEQDLLATRNGFADHEKRRPNIK